MLRLTAKQGASARPCTLLTERRGEPTGGPARTPVRVGGGGNSVRHSGESRMQQRMPSKHPGSTEGSTVKNALTSVKLDLLIAKFDYYVVTNPLPGDWPLSFAINREGIFLFVKPVQFALLWPWVKL